MKISKTVLQKNVLKNQHPKAKYPLQIHPLPLAFVTALTTCLAYVSAGIAFALLYPCRFLKNSSIGPYTEVEGR